MAQRPALCNKFKPLIKPLKSIAKRKEKKEEDNDIKFKDDDDDFNTEDEDTFEDAGEKF